jgi:hypothetical protein
MEHPADGVFCMLLGKRGPLTALCPSLYIKGAVFYG